MRKIVLKLGLLVFLVGCGSDDSSSSSSTEVIQGLSTPSNISVVPAE